MLEAHAFHAVLQVGHFEGLIHRAGLPIGWCGQAKRERHGWNIPLRCALVLCTWSYRTTAHNSSYVPNDVTQQPATPSRADDSCRRFRLFSPLRHLVVHREP